MRLHTSILLVFMLLANMKLGAQPSPIVAVRPSVEQNQLVVRTTFQNLLREDMLDALASGMSQVLHIHFALISTSGTRYVESRQTVTLRYNVWERSYHIQTALLQRELSSLARFTRFLNDSLRFSLGSIRGLPRTQRLIITTAFSPEPITAAQQSRLNRWLASVSTASDDRSTDSESTFSINLSGLIARFMNMQRKEKLHVLKTGAFKISDLKSGRLLPQ